MPKTAQYSVSWSPERKEYLFIGPDNSTPLDEGASWQAWLGEHRAFAFHGRNGHLNLLKEQRRGGGAGYWYAYQRHKGGMLKRYIGRGEQVNIEGLEEIAALLADVDEKKEASHETISPMPTKFIYEDVALPKPQLEPLLMPKLQLPRHQKRLLPRERLLALLDTTLERKLTLISGPAGYGKTTLISQWVTQRATRSDFPHVASVTLDEGDNDPIRFWRYIIAACQQFQVGFGKDALALLLAHRLPSFKPLEMMLTALLNELSQLEHSYILVLDDFHVISSSNVIETLSFFLDHLPATFHLIILIRGDVPFSLTRLRARNELLDIYPPQLGFSLEETHAFFEQELSFPPSSKLLRQIYEKTDGWPTGLRLLARELQGTNNAQDIDAILASFAGSYWSIQDYFLTEVLHTLPSDQQEFLLQTCMLPRMTAELCDAIRERTDSAQLIQALYSGDLFLIPPDTTRTWTRYQSLFAEAMQQEAHRQLGDEQLRRLAIRASEWYEQHGLRNEAIETALNAATFTRVINLIWQLMEGQPQSHTPAAAEVYTLNRWLEHVPDEDIERNPDVCVHYAMTRLFLLMEGPRLAQEKERIYHLLQVAEQKWRDANNTAKLAGVFAFRALLARQEGRILQAITWARQALSWLPPDDHTWRSLSLTVAGIGEILDGSLDKARKALLEALTLSEQQGNLAYARATRNMLAGASLEQGELRQAAEQFRQIQAEARMQEDYDDIARTQLGLAHLAYQWNNLTEAEQAAHEALEIGKQMNVEEFQVQATVQLALIEHAHGQIVQAQQRLIAWLAYSQTPSSPYSYQLARTVQATLAGIQLAGGNLAAVERWFSTIEKSEETLPLLQRQHEQVLWARLLLAQGNHITAIEQLEKLYITARQTGHLYFSLEIQSVLALAYAGAESHSKARQQLRELLATAHSEGYLRLFLDEGQAMIDLLRNLLPSLHEKVLLTYARHILSAFAQPTGTPTPEDSAASMLLASLSSQERKVLRLLAAGNSNAEIARELVVSVNTIRTQIQSIYRKLNVNNRVEASALTKYNHPSNHAHG